MQHVILVHSFISAHWLNALKWTRKNRASMGSKSALLRTLVAAESAKTAGFAVPSSVPNLGRQNNLDSLDCNYWDFFPLRRIKETACQERLDETKRIAT